MYIMKQIQIQDLLNTIILTILFLSKMALLT